MRMSDQQGQDSVLHIRVATADEWRASAIPWASQQQWNLGTFDGHTLLVADLDGFFIGLIGKEIVGCVSAVRHGDTKGHIGFYLVAEEHRGKSYGLALFKHAMKHLAGRKVSLDAVEAQISNYQRSGFHLTRWNHRFKALPSSMHAVEPSPDGVLIEDMQPEALDELLKLDSDSVMLERSKEFVEAFMQQPQLRAYVARGTSEGAQGMLGIICVRPAEDGYRIGPWYARRPDVASALLSRALKFPTDGTAALHAGVQHDEGTWQEKQYVYMDLAIDNATAIMLTQKFGMEKVFSLARMWTGSADVVEDLSVLYAHWSVEIG